MAQKRQNGEGTWGKKMIKGVQYFYFRDAKQHYTYGKSQKEVKAKLEAAKEKKHEVKLDTKITVGEYMKAWLYGKKYKEVGISLDPGTFDCYEDALTKRLYDYPFALLQISALDKDNIQEHLKKLSETYARSTITKTWQVIRLALKEDDKDFELRKFVPDIEFSKIKVPAERHCKVKAKNIEFTSNEDMDALYNEALKKKPTGAYYYGNAAKLLAFIMYSGLRESEACGLQWKDVDLANGYITLNQTYNIVKKRDEHGNAIGKEYIVKGVKTESSAATIPYRERGGKILELMNSTFPNHKPTDFVFLTDTRTPFQKRHVLHTLDRMLKNTNLTDKGYTVHALRHGYGSILYQEGVDIYTISKLLRHKDIETTTKIYVKTTPKTLKNALDSLDSKKNAPAL